MNLRLEAKAAGVVSDSRLLFYDLFPLESHLQIKGLADLFLDTAPFNAHSTAVDALWAKVPLVTLPLDTMASRVAYSLLDATFDEADGVVQSMKGYEDTAAAFMGP